MVAIPENGELRQTPLPRLLLLLYRARIDGRLHLRRERADKSFLLQAGVPVSADSNLASESLGVQLLDSGRLSREDHVRASQHVQAKSCREGTALLELGLIDARGLFSALKEQVRLRLVDCFGWPDGTFEIDPNERAPEDAQAFRADVYPLVQEGIATHWSHDRILTDLTEHMDAIVKRNRRTARVQDRLLWDDDMQAFIDSLDGSTTLWQAVQKARTPQSLAAVWLLDAISAIDYRDPDVLERSTEVEIVLTDEAPRSEAATKPAPETSSPASERGIDDVLIQEIAEKSESLGTLDHYALLGVGSDAAPGEIRSAYLQAAKRFHPDALARAGIDGATRETAGRVFAAIGKAHAVLANARRRAEYDAQRDLDDADIDAERLAAAETNYRKAEILMRQGNFRGAIEYLKPAVDLWPDEPVYHAALGWSLFKKAPSEPEDARVHLERAHGLEPRNAETAYHLSLVLMELGDAAEAERMLEIARDIDPAIGSS
jgi:tetratricopeptide (TPR) repeat protein